MADRYIAIDSFSDWTLPDGIIAGIAKSRAALVSAGFDGTTYSGSTNRLVVQDDQAGIWNNDIQRGWYYHSSTYVQTPPKSLLQQKKEAVEALHDQINSWRILLGQLGMGNDPILVNQGLKFLYRADGANYLVAHDSNLTAAQVINWCNAMRRGAADITSPQSFLDSHNGDPGISVTDWLAWVDPASVPSDAVVSDASTIARLNLLDAVAVRGTIAGVDLSSKSWIEALTLPRNPLGGF